VVAAAVILPRRFKHHLLNDSKKLDKHQRAELKLMIVEKALDYAIAEVDNFEIDKINILNASFLAMHRAIAKLTKRPELLLIDGNRFNPYPGIAHECIIEGDGKYFSIAAASILAKTYRDELMWKYAKTYPGYGWETNVGYATPAHRKAIKELGMTALHRQSFRCKTNQLNLFD
jgi:ribonuclease HII